MSQQPIGSRQEMLDRTVDDFHRKGYRIVAQSGWSVEMEKGRKVNHLLHFLVGFFTFATWWAVWFFLAISNRHRRIAVHVDEFMNVTVRRL